MKKSQDHFEVLRKIQKEPMASQRKLAKELDFSLGKLNYCLKALKEKGYIKTKNFKKNPNKLSYVYFNSHRYFGKNKTDNKFYEKKMKEYDELKKELNNKI